MTHILYGAPASLFSGKARSYLDWKRIDYEEQMPSPEVMRDVIIPAVGYPVVPVVRKEDGTIIQDTTSIIDHFETEAGGPSVYPDTPVQKLVALLFELYGDEWLVIPAMHYRWNYNEEWIYGEFGKANLPDGSAKEQADRGREIGQRFKGFVPMLGINDTTIPAIEQSYEALLADLETHFTEHDYLLGTRPSIGDYGLIGPFYAHLYRDPESGKLMKRLAPNVALWVERMMDAAMPLSGDFLEDDAIPETLLPVLRRMMDEQLPHLEQVAKLYTAWTETNPGAAVPRAVGMAPYTIEGVANERFASPFSLWMLQRPLEFYRALDGADKAAVDALLEAVGGSAFQDFAPFPSINFGNGAMSQA
ncbi:glutathione S-transferase [Parasphingopyxis lamellibrachiae]|uniref:Glutathione S-transferase n=1 Tax=Parasphingopyxis lamellibrachiae TaxID=680125 RepID=A0A3D9FEK3_9SPHN|nr:glutathione S-transferase [Parasphingopyxis lamellibrachiae]RED16250.1 glutathione S-transferase [Parasphingopyxis lamellibrachiae]